MAAAHPTITAMGAAALGIGTAAPYQARNLMERSVPFDLLIDPRARAYKALGLLTQSLLRYVFNIRAWWRWLRAFVVHGQRRVTGHYSVLPGVAVVDAAGTVHYLYKGTGLGDYPELDDVLDHLAALAGNN